MARPTFTSLARWSTYSERLPLRVREITSYAPVIALEAPICLPHAATGPSFGVPLVMAQERGTMLLQCSLQLKLLNGIGDYVHQGAGIHLTFR